MVIVSYVYTLRIMSLDGVPTEEKTEGNEDVSDEEFQSHNESEPDASGHDETQSVTECLTMDANPGDFSILNYCNEEH